MIPRTILTLTPEPFTIVPTHDQASVHRHVVKHPIGVGPLRLERPWDWERWSDLGVIDPTRRAAFVSELGGLTPQCEETTLAPKAAPRPSIGCHTCASAKACAALPAARGLAGSYETATSDFLEDAARRTYLLLAPPIVVRALARKLLSPGALADAVVVKAGRATNAEAKHDTELRIWSGSGMEVWLRGDKEARRFSWVTAFRDPRGIGKRFSWAFPVGYSLRSPDGWYVCTNWWSQHGS